MTNSQEEVIWAFLNQELKDVRGRRVQETCCFKPDFFQRFSVTQIPDVLRRWRLVERVQQSHDAAVVVTGDGLWRKDGTRWL